METVVINNCIGVGCGQLWGPYSPEMIAQRGEGNYSDVLYFQRPQETGEEFFFRVADLVLPMGYPNPDHAWLRPCDRLDREMYGNPG